MMDSFEVRVGGDDHLCCGDEIELNSLVRLRARRRGDPAVLTEVRHPAERDWDLVFVEGRVTDIHAVVSVGAGVGEERAPITRLPSGRAIRGFDSVDDGLLLSVMNEEPAIGQANGFVVTVLGRCIPDAVPDVNSNASTAGWWW